ncbi:TLDc domain-containing protein [Balamuthia mandrillaris]
MFSGAWKLQPDTDGAYFIDRDPKHFRLILNYLRTGELIPPEKKNALLELRKELEFYQLTGLLEQPDQSEGALSQRETVGNQWQPKPSQTTTNENSWQPERSIPGIFDECTLANEEQQQLLAEWVGSGNNKWRLAYRASRDGFSTTTFHDLCDHLTETVVLLRSKGYVFGGYTPLPWGTKGSGWDLRTFIFTLTNPHNIPPTKYSHITPRHRNAHSIWGMDACGPAFGGAGSDVFVKQKSCRFDFPTSFADSTGKGSVTFIGCSSGTVDQIEVFCLVSSSSASSTSTSSSSSLSSSSASSSSSSSSFSTFSSFKKRFK